MAPAEIFARRVFEARSERGWSQRRLAEATSALGHPLSRVTVTKIENGQRTASVSDVFALAAALETTPVDLLALREGEGAVAVAPELELEGREAQAWTRGLVPLPGGDFAAYFAQLPKAMQEALLRGHFERGLGLVERALVADQTDERVENVQWELTEGERIRREEGKQQPTTEEE